MSVDKDAGSIIRPTWCETSLRFATAKEERTKEAPLGDCCSPEDDCSKAAEVQYPRNENVTRYAGVR